jgi:hypothetical protein
MIMRSAQMLATVRVREADPAEVCDYGGKREGPARRCQAKAITTITTTVATPAGIIEGRVCLCPGHASLELITQAIAEVASDMLAGEVHS